MNIQKLKNPLYHKRPHFLKQSAEHTMGESVKTYIDIKIHDFVKEKKYRHIVIVGEYDRSCAISKYEKKGKITNWQRPTAELRGETLIIKCFPGYEYVKHYANLIASYLSLNGQDPSIVSYILPTEDECWEPILAFKTEKIPLSETAVLGYGLPEIAQTDDWQGNDQYLWSKKTINGREVTFIIFQFSFWGDILGRITRKLSQDGFKRIIFTAKVGGLRPEHIPNKTLVTGNKTFLEGQIVTWDNLFKDLKHPDLMPAVHFNSCSSLYETNDWLENICNFDIVESEIGHFAKAALDSEIEFGYLHFISNSLVNRFNEDLSNEREQSVIEKRAAIKEQIRQLLHSIL